MYWVVQEAHYNGLPLSYYSWKSLASLQQRAIYMHMVVFAIRSILECLQHVLAFSYRFSKDVFCFMS
ncbi:hypothetical protein L218DRAFT_236981 [Marasmius fiardii PR-910]|nr:hypothetical protein L218DRAFT_236981 [Marasmius fiardii PR-910]